MCDTMALPVSTPKWPRRFRRLLTSTALLVATLALSWSLVKMADEGGVVAHIGGVEINASIDDQMMLNLRISGTVPASVDNTQSTRVSGKEGHIDYNDEDDQMVDLPNNYGITKRSRSDLNAQVASK